MEKEDDFLNNYQKIYFQENSNDLFKTADAKRKCIAQTFKASHNLLNNTTSCDVLNEIVTSYSDLVNDLKGINNYADNMKVLTSQLVEKDYTKWTSNLNINDFKDLLEPLACEKQCSKVSDMKDQINMLFKKEEKENVIEPIIANKEKHEGQRKNYQCQENTNSFQRNKFFQASSSKSTTNVNKPKLEIRSVAPENNVQEEKSNKYGMFKTAKDELQEQNIKKYGKASGNAQQTLNYGASKRSLGTRRGVQSKFVPPVKTDYEGSSAVLSRNNSNNYQAETTEEVDERLKNIDPKMVELIRSEIMDSGAKVNWDDIAGLEFAKTAIKEAVVWPLLRPDIFTGLRRPPKGILLFGPPGTGKTLIGKCIASQSQSTFFSISASSLTSKWIGDGEKMVRAMFAVARVHQPAVIFIDEIDSLLSQRSDTEHESSRRIKTEFLVQLDGAATADDERILLVGATNRPQELDEAARRRFVKRLYIPLPEKAARLEIVKRLMSNERNHLSEQDINDIADLSNGYSGADMKNLCSEASLGPIRSMDFSMIENIQVDEVRPVTMIDFKSALNRVRASVSVSDLDQYIVWDKTYGSGGW